QKRGPVEAWPLQTLRRPLSHQSVVRFPLRNALAAGYITANAPARRPHTPRHRPERSRGNGGVVRSHWRRRHGPALEVTHEARPWHSTTLPGSGATSKPRSTLAPSWLRGGLENENIRRVAARPDPAVRVGGACIGQRPGLLPRPILALVRPAV